MITTLFALTFLGAAPFWALMILAPGWHWTTRIVSSPLIVSWPVLIYAVLAVPRLGTLLPAVSSPTLAGVQALLATPAGAALGWAHFIAFDLFVGRWMYLDARTRRIRPLVMAPVLILTILLAPLGLLLHLIIRPVAGRPDPDRLVGGQREAEPTAGGRPVHRGNHRPGQRVHRTQRPDGQVLQGVQLGGAPGPQRAGLVEVVAGAETLPGR